MIHFGFWCLRNYSKEVFFFLFNFFFHEDRRVKMYNDHLDYEDEPRQGLICWRNVGKISHHPLQGYDYEHEYGIPRSVWKYFGEKWRLCNSNETQVQRNTSEEIIFEAGCWERYSIDRHSRLPEPCFSREILRKNNRERNFSRVDGEKLEPSA